MKLTKAQCWIRIHGLSMEYWQPKSIFSIARGIDTHLSLDDCTMNKSIGFFARVLVDIDMLYALPNQILVEGHGFVFIADNEFEKLPPFFFSCKMIEHDISKCIRHFDNLNNTLKSPIVVVVIIVQYKPMTFQTKETNDAPHKEVVGVTEKQNYAVEIQIYDVMFIMQGWWKLRELLLILITLLRLLLLGGCGSPVSQKFKKSTEDIGGWFKISG